MRVSFGDRWRRTWSDTRSFRAWKRDVTVSLLVGTLTYVTLLRYGSAQSARDQLIVAAVVTLVTAILLPAAELVSNFARAPFRMAEDEIQRLIRDREVLQRQLEAATGWKGITNTKLQEFWNRGAELRRAILDDPDDSESANQQRWSQFKDWRRELLDFVHGLSPSKAAYLDEVQVVGTPISYAGKTLSERNAHLVKQIDSRLERLKNVMQDYAKGGAAKS